MPTSIRARSVRVTLAERVYREVRTRIMESDLGPGQFIREQELREATGVSRTPIREALSRLASEGFLEKIPHRGFRVPDEPLGELLELYPVVAALELLAGRLALPRLNGRDVARLREINDALVEARDRGDVQELMQLNEAFHHLFGERSGNSRLSGLLDDLRLQLSRLERWYYSYSDRATESILEHERIIEAIENGDHHTVLDLLETNMSLTYRRLVEDTSGAGAAAP